MNVTRNSYFKRLQEWSDTDRRVMFVSADCAGLVFDEYRKTHPERFVHVGIAEQNMIAVACGLALAGKSPITYGHAPFSTIRALDQIRNGVAMMNLTISMVVNGVGFAQPYFGATHFNTEDFSIMSSIPGIQVITPSSPSMGIAAADYALETHGPLYVRFDPECDKELYGEKTIDFSKGFEILRYGKDAAVITSAGYTHRVLALVEEWMTRGMDVMVLDLYSVPFHISALLDTIGNRPVAVIDEQTAYGSLGARLLRDLNTYSRNNTVQLLDIDFGPSYPEQSTIGSSYFQQEFGLTDRSIAERMEALVHKMRNVWI